MRQGAHSTSQFLDPGRNSTYPLDGTSRIAPPIISSRVADSRPRNTSRRTVDWQRTAGTPIRGTQGWLSKTPSISCRNHCVPGRFPILLEDATTCKPRFGTLFGTLCKTPNYG